MCYVSYPRRIDIQQIKVYFQCKIVTRFLSIFFCRREYMNTMGNVSNLYYNQLLNHAII